MSATETQTQTRTQSGNERLSRRWTRLFFRGKPRGWKVRIGIFGAAAIGLYLIGSMVLPLLLMD